MSRKLRLKATLQLEFDLQPVLQEKETFSISRIVEEEQEYLESMLPLLAKFLKGKKTKRTNMELSVKNVKCIRPSQHEEESE